MPDAIVILVLIVVVGLVVVILRSASSGPGRPSQPPEVPVTSPRAHIPYTPSDLTVDEDFYRDEDEFAVFADEGDEGDE